MAAEKRSSVLGGLFRRLADFFDRRAAHKPHTTRFLRAYAGTPLEIDFFAFGILFFGVTAGGIIIHGLAFAGWVILFALLLAVGAWLIFYSAHWTEQRRSLLLAFLLVLSLNTIAERIMALVAFVILFLLLAYARLRNKTTGENLRSVTAVLLFCFVAYDGFSLVLASRRSALLAIESGIRPVCAAGVSSRVACRAGTVEFDVPEFWRPGGLSRIASDLDAITDLVKYSDSATDNVIAFGAFSAQPDQVMQQIATFLSAQKTFLQSRDRMQVALVPQLLMKGADVQLYNLSYQSYARPGYLGELADNNAIFFLHRRRDTTWLFILDGNDFSGREFLLHRIISGFR